MTRSLAVGGLTLDYVCTQEGTASYDEAGGNALYSAVGMLLAGGEPKICARVGRDYPEQHLKDLAEAGIGTRGVNRVQALSFHTVFRYSANGARAVSYQKGSGTNRELDPTVPEIASCLPVDIAHICPIPPESQAVAAMALNDSSVPFSLDVIDIPDQIVLGELPGAATDASLFLPSKEETTILWGADFENAIRTMRQLKMKGAIKQGKDGCTILDDDKLVDVPAYQTKPIDSTGAGDTFCGAFLVRWAQEGDLVEAAIAGNVAASFAIEDFGGLHATSVSPSAFAERSKSIRSRLRTLL